MRGERELMQFKGEPLGCKVELSTCVVRATHAVAFDRFVSNGRPLAQRPLHRARRPACRRRVLDALQRNALTKCAGTIAASLRPCTASGTTPTSSNSTKPHARCTDSWASPSSSPTKAEAESASSAPRRHHRHHVLSATRRRRSSFASACSLATTMQCTCARVRAVCIRTS